MLNADCPQSAYAKGMAKRLRKKFGGEGNEARHMTIGQAMAEIKSCRRLVPMTVRLKHCKTFNTTLTAAQDMKYSQACQVKTVVDQAINALERATWDGTADAASKKWLAAPYVSRPRKGVRDMADTLRRKTGSSWRNGQRTCVGPGTPKTLTQMKTTGRCGSP